MRNRRQVLVLLFTLLLGASSLLAGCGQKGPLFLPDETEKEEQKEGSDT